MVKGTILPCYTKSEDQLAEIFTKSASLKVSFIPSGFLTKVLTRKGYAGSKLSHCIRLSLRGSVKKRPRLCPDTLVHQGKDLACDQRQRHKFSLVTVGMLPLEIQNARKTKEGSRRKGVLNQ
ncbi:unnamed protein product [Cochlearia groenlandica]